MIYLIYLSDVWSTIKRGSSTSITMLPACVSYIELTPYSAIRTHSLYLLTRQLVLLFRAVDPVIVIFVRTFFFQLHTPHRSDT